MTLRLRLAALLVLWCGSAVAETHRFAVVLGNNAGSGARPTLRYAETDAVKMARVLSELGEVPEQNLVLLKGRGVAEVEEAVAVMQTRIAEIHRQPDARAVLLFYYSGHGDGEALELGRERLAYPTLRAMLQGSGADLKVAIIDACRSGSAVQEKGGRLAAPFTIRLSDQATARGEIFITSSAADESALESQEIRGSFFTHNLITGLRGAADVSGDRLVTLAEAYRFAYERTVAATAVTFAGAQHPHYDYRLSGQGELVLASLIRSTSTLQLPDGAERALVTDVSRDQVMAELLPGGPREIALGAGTYGIRLVRGGQTYGGRFRIEEGTRYAVRWEDVDPIAASAVKVAQKGGPAVQSQPVQVAAASDVAHGSRRRSGGLFGLGMGGGAAVSEGAGLQGALRLGYEPSPRTGFAFALVVNGGSGLTGGVGETAVGARVGYRAAVRTERVSFSIGAEVGAAQLWMSDGLQVSSSPAFIAGPRAAFRVKVGGPAWLGLEGEAPFTLYRDAGGEGGVGGGLRAAMTPSVMLGMALEL